MAYFGFVIICRECRQNKLRLHSAIARRTIGSDQNNFEKLRPHNAIARRTIEVDQNELVLIRQDGVERRKTQVLEQNSAQRKSDFDIPEN